MLLYRPLDVRKVLPLFMALCLFAASQASAQTACSASKMTGMWKLISEDSVAESVSEATSASAASLPAAEYLEVRSGLLFWVSQPTDGQRTRDRHKLFFSGSTLDVRPPLAKAPQIVRCTLSGRRMVLLTAAFAADGTQRRGRLEFRKTGR